MTVHSDTIPLTGSAMSTVGRVMVDEGSSGFYRGMEYRAYKEINKTSAAVWYFRFTAPIDFILLAQRLALVQGAVRLSAWTGATFTGAWNNTVTPIGRNRMSNVPFYPEGPAGSVVYAPQVSLSFSDGTAGTFTGGTEVDVMMLSAGSNQGNNRSSNVGVAHDVRGLPAGTYGLKMEAISGVTNTDQVRGVFELIWEERPPGV